MKKFMFLAATAALALSSCSNEEALEQPQAVAENDGAVNFSAYTARQTRAEIHDVAQLALTGFGVFAYAQETQGFDAFMTSTVTPNFMYNQQVVSMNSGVDWTYAPTKFYSNNPGAKHSFFAYAPYIATTAFGTTGNPSLVFNTMYQGPALKYTFSTTGVDILCAPAFIDKEKPAFANIDTEVQYDGNPGKMSFAFKHALSKLSFNIQTWVDEQTDAAACGTATTPVPSSETTITVKSIKLIGNFATTGILRLRDGKWDTSAAETQSVEIVNTPYVMAATGIEEVPAAWQNLLFIPADGAEVFKIQIVYDVTTTDTGDSKNSSTITNTITSEQAFPLAQNTAYQYHLNLGLETVRFDATVTDWEDGDIEEVALPENN